MKTSNLFYIMLLYATINLEAKPKKRCGEALLATTADQTDTNSTGGQQPPVATRTNEEALQSSDMENSPTLPAPTPSPVNSTKTSASISPTTPRASSRFYEDTSAFNEAPVSPTHTSGQRGLPSKRSSYRDLDEVSHAEVTRLEEEARENRNPVQLALGVLQEYGILGAVERFKDVTLDATMSDLTRILFLDHKFKLKAYLETFLDETQQGEWLTRGLAQAVEQKSIDNTTRMLNIIHEHGLTHFVPTQHQDDAANLLLTHDKKTTIDTLPKTLRRHNQGDKSPRSKATEEKLRAILQSYGYNSKEDAKIAEFIAQLKNIAEQK